jgi:hypothetical protein
MPSGHQNDSYMIILRWESNGKTEHAGNAWKMGSDRPGSKRFAAAHIALQVLEASS